MNCTLVLGTLPSRWLPAWLIPAAPMNQLHGRPIPLGYAVVEVDEAVEQYRHVEVDYPAEEGANTIGDNEHTFIAWEKAYIVFPPDTAPENLFSPRRPLPSSPPKSPSSPAISWKKSTSTPATASRRQHHQEASHRSRRQHHQGASHHLGKHDQVPKHRSRPHHLRSRCHLRRQQHHQGASHSRMSIQ